MKKMKGFGSILMAAALMCAAAFSMPAMASPSGGVLIQASAPTEMTCQPVGAVDLTVTLQSSDVAYAIGAVESVSSRMPAMADVMELNYTSMQIATLGSAPAALTPYPRE